MPVNYGAIRTVDLSDLADGLIAQRAARKAAAERERIRKAEFDYRAQQAKIAQDFRNAEEKRQNNAETRAQTTFDESKKDLVTKRAKEEKDRINSLLGEHAQIMEALPAEQQEDYYQAKVVPLLTEGQTGRINVPEAVDAPPVLEAMSQSPAERIAANKAAGKGSVDYVLKPNENGELVYMPKTPTPTMKTGPNGERYSGVTGQPQMFQGQGENGPVVITAPRSGAQPTAVRPVAPATGAPIGRPKIPIPTSVKQGIDGNIENLKDIDKVLSLLNTPGIEPNTPLSALAGKFGSRAYQAVNPKSLEAKALLAKIRDMKIYDVTGAASAARQDARYQEWLPKEGVFGDDNKALITKLTLLRADAIDKISRAKSQYATSDYKADPLLGTQTQQALVPVKAKPKVVETDIDNMTEEELKAFLGEQ